jgi:hypothetical protein
MGPEKLTYKELLIQNEKLCKIAVLQDNSIESLFRKRSDNIDDVFWIRTHNVMICITSISLQKKRFVTIKPGNHEP